MRPSLVMAAAVAGTASAQSAPSTTALTFWNPGPSLNPSLYSKQGFPLTTYPPVASIITSDAATTIFQLGCPSSPRSPVYDGTTTLTCPWATDIATYTLINGTRNVMHETVASPAYSQWWTCDYNTAATQMTCALEVIGGQVDTGGPISDWVIPDKKGNVVAFATAEIVTEGSFEDLLPTGSASASASASASGLMTDSKSAPVPTATQGSGVAGSGPSRTASASASVATASTAAAVKYGVEGVALAVLAGAAAVNVW